MSSKLLSSIAIFAICSASLSACSSVSDKIPVVKIERKKPKVIKTQSASYISPSAIGSGSTLQSSEAAIICENDKMRARAADDNYKNDTARVLILEDNSDDASQVVGDTTVNCRNYFANQSARITSANYDSQYNANNITQRQYIPQQATPTPALPFQPQLKPDQAPIAQSGLFYSVNRGDTLYRIAKNHCTSVQAIKRLNNIDDPTTLDVDTILRMPVGNCN